MENRVVLNDEVKISAHGFNLTIIFGALFSRHSISYSLSSLHTEIEKHVRSPEKSVALLSSSRQRSGLVSEGLKTFQVLYHVFR